MTSGNGKAFYGCKRHIPMDARIKRLFAIQIEKIDTPLSRTVGITKLRAKIGSRNLTYHTDWLGMLRAASAAAMGREDETTAKPPLAACKRRHRMRRAPATRILF